jgi:hypothetical protein
MKAKELIKILEKFPERDVKIYLDIVNDWLDIEILDDELVKMKPSYHLDLINYDKMDNKMTLEDYKEKIIINKPKYELKSDFVDYENKEIKQNYTFKPIFLMKGKPRGLCTFDRLGKIYY